MIHIAVLILAIAGFMQSYNASRMARRIRNLEKEHDHLAEKCGEAIKKALQENDRVLYSTEKLIRAADQVIKEAAELIESDRELKELMTSKGEVDGEQ